MIFVGTVTGVIPEPLDGTTGPISAVRFRVDEAFKGTTGGEQVTVLARQAGNCCGTLPEFAEGRQFLLFTLWDDKIPMVGPCDPVIPIAEASDHLAYLRNLAAHHVPTEVYGSVYMWDHLLGGSPPENKALSGVRVTFNSDAGTLDAISDAQGRFRRNLPPGDYEIGADVPQYFDRSGAMSFALAPESCVEASVVLQYNGMIEGRAMDDHGNPAVNATISLFGSQTNEEVNFASTDADGKYTLEGIAPGDYVLGVNVGPLPDKDRPYAPIFYPSATRRENARTIHLEPGEQIQVADIIASTDRCTIVMRVLDAMGKPVSGATLAAQVFDHDHFYVLHDPEVITNGQAVVPAWGHDRLQIYANLDIDGGQVQSEPQWIPVCPKKPVTLRLNRRY